MVIVIALMLPHKQCLCGERAGLGNGSRPDYVANFAKTLVGRVTGDPRIIR